MRKIKGKVFLGQTLNFDKPDADFLSRKEQQRMQKLKVDCFL